jgi:signal transduction histidine kinase
MLDSEFKDHNIEFSITLTRKPGTLTIDQEKIVTSIQTLVENALHYTRDGGKVHLNIHRDDKHFYVEVEDTGIGIPKSEQGRIFEQFYRGDEARRVNPEGLGVGLFMVRTFVEKHRGKMVMQSEVGKGTKFIITLPLASVEDPVAPATPSV